MYKMSCDFRLKAEWDYSKNEKEPGDFKRFSNKKVWWLCEQGHSWEAVIASRSRGHGCPYCFGGKVLSENSICALYPNLLNEWDPLKNVIDPHTLGPSSSQKVWWLCEKGHSWECPVTKRAKRNFGCPYCSGRRVSSENRLSVHHPLLCEEWDFDKNKSSPTEVSYGSGSKYWWKCLKGHGWEAYIYNRLKGQACPYCSGRRLLEENSLYYLRSDLCSSWSPANTLAPKEVSLGSQKKVWWTCGKCSHTWEARVAHRVAGSGCPLCSSGPISLVSQQWLSEVGIDRIKHEFRIDFKDSFIRVDGFDPKTNTVYEFLGDYWHGNPALYHEADINPTNNKKYGVLLAETEQRFLWLLAEGYKVKFVWEADFKRGILFSSF